MTGIDQALSDKARRHIGTRAKACYHNAYTALGEMPELAGGLYVEGCAICDGDNVIEHGWIELDGRIVDPTLYDQGNVSYFAGLRFTQRQAWDAIRTIPKPPSTEDLPIFYRFGRGGCDSPEMMRAFAAAWESIGAHDIAQRFLDQIDGSEGDE